MNLDLIDAHKPIFEHWVKGELNSNMMPEGMELIKWWYRYVLSYNDYVDSLRVIVAPEVGEGGPDD